MSLAHVDAGASERLAQALGWFSIALGLAQVAAPSAVCRLVGAQDTERTRTAMRARGATELAAGAGILLSDEPAPWLWFRVAGDVLDLAALANVARDDDGATLRPAVNAVAVAGVTALDVAASLRFARRAVA